MNHSIDNASLNFVCRAADKFLPGAIIQLGEHKFRGKNINDQCDFRSLVVSGQYDFMGDVGICNLDIAIPEPNGAWFNYPPIVVVRESWLSPVFSEQDPSYANWHRYPSGEICWIKPNVWIDRCKSISDLTGLDHIIGQMLKDVDFVLSCHMAAFCHRLCKWQSSWPCAPHGY
jgi:hypothetical protein